MQCLKYLINRWIDFNLTCRHLSLDVQRTFGLNLKQTCQDNWSKMINTYNVSSHYEIFDSEPVVLKAQFALLSLHAGLYHLKCSAKLSPHPRNWFPFWQKKNSKAVYTHIFRHFKISKKISCEITNQIML